MHFAASVYVSNALPVFSVFSQEFKYLNTDPWLANNDHVIRILKPDWFISSPWVAKYRGELDLAPDTAGEFQSRPPLELVISKFRSFTIIYNHNLYIHFIYTTILILLKHSSFVTLEIVTVLRIARHSSSLCVIWKSKTILYTESSYLFTQNDLYK